MSNSENFGEDNPNRHINRNPSTKYQQYADACRTKKQAICDYCRSKYEKYGRWKYVKRAIGVLTVIGVWVYTILTFGLLINSQTSLTAVQRAFIVASELKIEPAAGNTLRLMPVIKNSGNTPAVGVSIVVITPFDEVYMVPSNMSSTAYSFLSWKIGSPRDPDELIDHPNDIAFMKSNFTLGSQGGITASRLTVNMTVQNGIDAQANKIGRFIYGSIRYSDVFDTGHTSKFCFRTDGVRGDAAGSIGLVQDICTHWNCTDKYCEQDKAAYEAALKKTIAPK
jgi:hypothetical protein